jgi:hypothetical protein
MYRRIDPEYFAWLRLRMLAAKEAADAGRVPADVWQAARVVFNAIQQHAIALFGEAPLRGTVRTLDAAKYRPPFPEEYEKPQAQPSQPPEPAIDARLEHARAQIAGIRERALTLGWREERLYAQAGHAKGRITLLHPGEQIGTVTREAIEIILPSGVRQHFYNPDVEQPWIRRAKK